MMALIKDIQEADLVITIKRNGEIKAIKNRDGEVDKKLDMATVLELLLPYQHDTFKQPIKKWIEEAHKYLALKVFW
jgi:hypothetical protein